MFLPDHGRGWVSRAAIAGRTLLREKNFDAVITSGCPHSSHFAGLFATRGHSVQFWLDMRDLGAVDCGSVVYVGTLYAGRNLSSVIAAMATLLRDRPDARTKLKLSIAGPIDSPYHQRLSAEVAAAGLIDVVTMHGVVRRERALDLLRCSNLALVLAQDQRLQVPAKLYESVGLGVPSLVIAEKTSAAAPKRVESAR
jgi:hypothetical protein